MVEFVLPSLVSFLKNNAGAVFLSLTFSVNHSATCQSMCRPVIVCLWLIKKEKWSFGKLLLNNFSSLANFFHFSSFWKNFKFDFQMILKFIFNHLTAFVSLMVISVQYRNSQWHTHNFMCADFFRFIPVSATITVFVWVCAFHAKV